MSYDAIIQHYTQRLGVKLDQARAAREILQRTDWELAFERMTDLEAAGGSTVITRGAKEWHFAMPLEGHARYGRPGDALPYRADTPPQHFCVVGSDGSQIFPDSRDAYAFAMVRVATITVDYSSSERPTVSQVVLTPEDDEILDILTSDERRPAEVRAAIGGLRDRVELGQAVLAAQAVKSASMTVVMVDGPLHMYEWTVPAMQAHAQAIGEVLGVGAIPTGVISGGDARYCVRLAGLLTNVNSDDEWPYIDDWDFWGHLSPGERSPVFGISSGYNVAATDENGTSIGFFYMNVGGHVMRVEVPALTTSSDIARLTPIIAAESIHLGYPYCLIKAHQLAVIQGAERQAYIDRFSSALEHAGLYEINRSPKEMLKAEL